MSIGIFELYIYESVVCLQINKHVFWSEYSYWEDTKGTKTQPPQICQ